MKLGIVIVADVLEMDETGIQVTRSKSVFGPESDYSVIQKRLKEFRENKSIAQSLGLTLCGKPEESFWLDYTGQRACA